MFHLRSLEALRGWVSYPEKGPESGLGCYAFVSGLVNYSAFEREGSGYVPPLRAS